MSSRIEQLIDEIEAYIDSCKPKFMSDTKIVVDREEMDELLRELRMKTPDEIKRYQKIISNKEAILADARKKADALIAAATEQTQALVSEHEIMQQAYARADEVVKMAQEQAQNIVDSAIMEANSVRTASAQYMDDMMNYLDNLISSSTQKAASNYEELLNSLNYYGNIIKNDRKQLHPEEYDMEVSALGDLDEAGDIEIID
ncbi:MAG: vacuolar family H+-ATPase subunit H [Lachnoclostridium sp.]|nr:vacuolar family H+-ATPase subunit H [Lachnospira sp.]MCM1248681.1 vacuolar family H+-ATPase subunit H [Lachnoclostridium sp.]